MEASGNAPPGRRLVTAAAACLAFAATLLAAPVAAPAAEFGHWRVAVKGSVVHSWRLTGDGPCGASGSGRVTAVASGRSKRFRLAYRADGRWRQWELSPPPFRARGRIRRTDRTTLNPPEPGAEPCAPTRKDGCGIVRPLHRRAIGSVEGMIPRRNPRMTFSFYNLMDAFPRRSRCYGGGFGDFSNFPGAPRAEYGRMIGPMPRPSRVGRRPFRVRIVQRRTARRGERRTRTVRRVVLRFTPA